MSLTSANAIITISISSLLPAPVQLQGFSADDIFSTGALKSAEVQMGVDGLLSGGFVNVPVPQTFDLMADSPSNSVFDTWWAAQEAAQDVYIASGVIILPGVGIKWTMVKGFLTSYQPLPDVKKLLQSRKFEITWQQSQPAVAPSLVIPI
jgi:hypothetical protein